MSGYARQDDARDWQDRPPVAAKVWPQWTVLWMPLDSDFVAAEDLPYERQFYSYQDAVRLVGDLCDDEENDWVQMTKAADDDDVRIFWKDGVFEDLMPAAECLLIADGVLEEGYVE